MFIFEQNLFDMNKMTLVFGAIMCFLGTVLLLVTIFLYMNTSAFLNYNVAKQPGIGQVKLFVSLLISVALLTFGVLFAKNKELDGHH